VAITEKPSKRLGFGIGVSTNSGVHGQIDYQDSNIDARGLRLTSALKLDVRQQSASADLLFPMRPDGYRYSLGALAGRSEIQGETDNKLGIALKRTRVAGRVERTVGVQYQLEHQVLAGAESDRRQALVPSYAWTYRNVDSFVSPQQGHVLALQAGGAVKALLSDQNFVRTHAKWTSLHPLGEDSTLLLRAEFGLVFAPDRRGIPSDFLFRAGGDQSIRGYAYQSLGVRQGAATVGGRMLGVASAEYIRWLIPNWGAAVFYDVGDAAENPREFSAKRGYGAGLRWRSPAGPVSFDLAYAREVRDFRVHFSFGFVF
jgi:translocation and assembly module TamA